MSSAGVFLLIAMATGVVTFVLWPLIAQSRPAVPAPKAKDVAFTANLAGLHADRAAILVTLRDLDFDFQTGKLTADDYQQQRETLLSQGADVLRRIDMLEAEREMAQS